MAFNVALACRKRIFICEYKFTTIKMETGGEMIEGIAKDADRGISKLEVRFDLWALRR